MAPTRTTIWLPITSTGLPPSSPDADAHAVAAIRKAADLAQPHGCSISLYPHFGSLLQTVPDALRLLHRVSRPNVGLTFNLCHWLRTEPGASLAETLKSAANHLQIVTLCGADRHGQDWKHLIQPLDRGDFKLPLLLSELRRQKFQGSIGLQGYDVAKNFDITPQESITRSMAAWQNRIATMSIPKP